MKRIGILWSDLPDAEAGRLEHAVFLAGSSGSVTHAPVQIADRPESDNFRLRNERQEAAMRGWLVVAALLATPATAQRSAEGWLQTRLDRIAAGAGREAGRPELRLSDDPRLRFSPDKTGRLQFSKAALRLAPDSRAVDGLLALMLSYSARLPMSTPGSSTAKSLIAGAAVLGAFAADPASDRQLAFDETEMDRDAAIARADAQRREAQIAAARALEWTVKAGGCRAATIDYLRILATSPTLDGRVARRVLDDLGAAVNDPDRECPTPPDPSFVAIKAALTSPAAAAP